MLAECEDAPQVFQETLDRMNAFVQPFAECLGFPAQRDDAIESVSGLITDLGRRNVESIANRHGHGRTGTELSRSRGKPSCE